jgi:hypothetical protein
VTRLPRPALLAFIALTLVAHSAPAESMTIRADLTEAPRGLIRGTLALLPTPGARRRNKRRTHQRHHPNNGFAQEITVGGVSDADFATSLHVLAQDSASGSETPPTRLSGQSPPRTKPPANK